MFSSIKLINYHWPQIAGSYLPGPNCQLGGAPRDLNWSETAVGAFFIHQAPTNFSQNVVVGSYICTNNFLNYYHRENIQRYIIYSIGGDNWIGSSHVVTTYPARGIYCIQMGFAVEIYGTRGS